MRLSVLPNREFKKEIRDKIIEIEGFSRYSVLIEGTQITSEDETPRKLRLSISLDGAINISLEKTKASEKDLRKILAQKLPKGYEFYFETEASKVIRGVRGHYYYFRHNRTKDIIAIAIGASKREYRIHLGRLENPNSKLGAVVRSLPDIPFRKAQLVHILPYSIVENRQPIKAALDVLEKEGFVRKGSKTGISQFYHKTDKPILEVGERKKVTEFG